uniref:N(alpha)-acetyltransferase 80, NatH catalytic subunit n=1 Tax=Labrus bergylta TaxID=56723 RepID=A0A3Q3EQS8_9LABR
MRQRDGSIKPNVDERHNSMSEYETQHAGSDCEISELGREVNQKVHTGSDQPAKIRAVPIHRRPDLLVPCADLVNSEWQRSQAARVHSLQKSCPEFPVCLVLLQGHREAERLLGHARLSQVVGHTSCLFVESVVVSEAERGERYAKSRGFKRLCLTTHDKQHFYAHIGYVLSTPVQNAGAMTAFVPMETLLRFSRMPSEEGNTQRETWAKTEAKVPQGSPPPSAIPPPPPLSSILSPPPPPPQAAGLPVVQTLTETPYRDARGVPIFWMHKDI